MAIVALASPAGFAIPAASAQSAQTSIDDDWAAIRSCAGLAAFKRKYPGANRFAGHLAARERQLGCNPKPSAPAATSESVTLIPGQGVSLTLGAGDRIKADAPHPAKLSSADMQALGLVRKSYAVDKTAQVTKEGTLAPITITNAEVPPDPIVRGRVELTFVVVENTDTVLVVRNGYGRSFAYRARITARGKSAPTDVCIVRPNNRGYEHWPYVIDKIELTEIHFEDLAPGSPPVCR